MNTGTKEFLKAGRIDNVFAHAVDKITSVLSVSSVAETILNFRFLISDSSVLIRVNPWLIILFTSVSSVAAYSLILLRALRELCGKFLVVFIHIERGAHGVLNKNKNYANFLSPVLTTTYRKKTLVVSIPFSHAARKFVLRVEGQCVAVFCLLPFLIVFFDQCNQCNL